MKVFISAKSAQRCTALLEFIVASFFHEHDNKMTKTIYKWIVNFTKFTDHSYWASTDGSYVCKSKLKNDLYTAFSNEIKNKTFYFVKKEFKRRSLYMSNKAPQI